MLCDRVKFIAIPLRSPFDCPVRTKLAFLLLLSSLALCPEVPAQNGAWQALFDGKTLEGWQLFNGKPIPKGWDVADGWLHGQGKNGGDILSAGQFEQFELEWEWKIAPKGNSGLKYFVPDSRKEALGHEYQMLDESDAASAHPDKHTTASFYDVLPPKPGLPLKPAGEINQSRVRVAANHVEHWLNGVKVLEYDCNSEAVKNAVAASKFKTTPGFGTQMRGHILLQDHGSEVWFRNIRLRVITP